MDRDRVWDLAGIIEDDLPIVMLHVHPDIIFVTYRLYLASSCLEKRWHYFGGWVHP